MLAAPKRLELSAIFVHHFASPGNLLLPLIQAALQDRDLLVLLYLYVSSLRPVLEVALGV